MKFVKLQDSMFLIFYAVKINKVFDFKINQKLCFLLINYNSNEPDFW